VNNVGAYKFGAIEEVTETDRSYLSTLFAVVFGVSIVTIQLIFFLETLSIRAQTHEFVKNYCERAPNKMMVRGVRLSEARRDHAPLCA
jgi:hypothetical protein